MANTTTPSATQQGFWLDPESMHNYCSSPSNPNSDRTKCAGAIICWILLGSVCLLFFVPLLLAMFCPVLTVQWSVKLENIWKASREKRKLRKQGKVEAQDHDLEGGIVQEDSQQGGNRENGTVMLESQPTQEAPSITNSARGFPKLQVKIPTYLLGWIPGTAK